MDHVFALPAEAPQTAVGLGRGPSPRTRTHTDTGSHLTDGSGAVRRETHCLRKQHSTLNELAEKAMPDNR